MKGIEREENRGGKRDWRKKTKIPELPASQSVETREAR
jgi:hypothetical protein